MSRRLTKVLTRIFVQLCHRVQRTREQRYIASYQRLTPTWLLKMYSHFRLVVLEVLTEILGLALKGLAFALEILVLTFQTMFPVLKGFVLFLEGVVFVLEFPVVAFKTVVLVLEVPVFGVEGGVLAQVLAVLVLERVE
jgi:hypothetical protein